jgi:hypothetical protein
LHNAQTKIDRPKLALVSSSACNSLQLQTAAGVSWLRHRVLEL